MSRTGLNRVLRKAAEIPQPDRSQLVAAAAPRFHGRQRQLLLQHALAALESIEDEQLCSRSIAALAPELDFDDLEKALHLALTLRDPLAMGLALTAIARRQLISIPRHALDAFARLPPWLLNRDALNRDAAPESALDGLEAATVRVSLGAHFSALQQRSRADVLAFVAELSPGTFGNFAREFSSFMRKGRRRSLLAIPDKMLTRPLRRQRSHVPLRRTACSEQSRRDAQARGAH
jgi:hypothetical protein